MIGIYVLEFSNGKKYVGQSNNIPRRIEEHFEDMRGVHKNKKIRHCVATCGMPTWRVVEECSLAALNAREIHWVAFFDSFRNGCNQTIGGGYPRKLVGTPSNTFPETKSAYPVGVLITAAILIGGFVLYNSPLIFCLIVAALLCLR